MGQLELKKQLQSALTDFTNNALSQGVSFSMMEDALYKLLVEIKDGVQREFIMELQQNKSAFQEEEEVLEDADSRDAE